MKTYTATEISNILCEADGITNGDDMQTTHDRVRYITKRDFLRGGEVIDARGTKAFPEIEVYHAAALADLLSVDMSAPILRKLAEAADALPLLDADQWAPSQRGDGVKRLKGGLRDAIRGASMGERWGLTVRQEQPGRSIPAQVQVAFGWLDAPCGNEDAVAAILGRKPNRLRILLELSDFFNAITERLQAN